jgi:hypothetical protein
MSDKVSAVDIMNLLRSRPDLSIEAIESVLRRKQAVKEKTFFNQWWPIYWPFGLVLLSMCVTVYWCSGLPWERSAALSSAFLASCLIQCGWAVVALIVYANTAE